MFALLSAAAHAQWMNYPTAGIPRNKDGAPNLTAPAPRTQDGKPDLSGLWGLPGYTTKYLMNLAADGIEVPMLPRAAALYKERRESISRDHPTVRCLPHSLTELDGQPAPKKIFQAPGVLVILFENHHTFRQIFTDGRPLPKDRDPAWFGYSLGKWEGDTLVVDTVGFKEKTWLDGNGHPHSDELHIIERFHRPDFGHMEVELTIDDPKTYARPWTVKLPWVFTPDTDLLDYICENEKDYSHMVGK